MTGVRQKAAKRKAQAALVSHKADQRKPKLINSLGWKETCPINSSQRNNSRLKHFRQKLNFINDVGAPGKGTGAFALHQNYPEQDTHAHAHTHQCWLSTTKGNPRVLTRRDFTLLGSSSSRV